MSSVTFFVAGVPVQQGSARAFVGKSGRAHITSDTRRGLVPWRAQVAAAAQERVDTLWAGPIDLRLEFVLPRPVSTPKRDARPWHTKVPDIDKLLRSIMDALTGVLYADDRQVARVGVSKVVAALGEQSGVHITASRCEP